MRISDVAHYPYLKTAGVVVFDTPEGEQEFYRRYPFGPRKAVRAYAGESLGGLDPMGRLFIELLSLAIVLGVGYMTIRFLALKRSEYERVKRRFPQYFGGMS